MGSRGAGCRLNGQMLAFVPPCRSGFQQRLQGGGDSIAQRLIHQDDRQSQDGFDDAKIQSVSRPTTTLTTSRSTS